MTNRKRKGLGAICLLLVFCILFAFASMAFTVCDTTDIANIEGFYKEPKNTLDVVSIGPSELYADYAPALAWEQQGYTSFDFNVGALPANLYKSVVEEVLKRQNPTLLVVNANGFLGGDWNYSDEVYLRKWIDNIPWSENKIRTIKEMVPEEEQLDYFLKIRKYHGNWKSPVKVAEATLLRLMVKAGGSRLKGFMTKSVISTDTEPGENQRLVFDDTVQDCLTDFMAYCKDRGIENVLFVAVPHQLDMPNQEAILAMQECVEDAGYDFLNLERAFSPVEIDPETDFSDNEHLNVYGMEKFTAYLAAYIKDHYNMNTVHDNKTAERWEKALTYLKRITDLAHEDLEQGRNDGYNEIDAYISPELQRKIKER